MTTNIITSVPHDSARVTTFRDGCHITLPNSTLALSSTVNLRTGWQRLLHGGLRRGAGRDAFKTDVLERWQRAALERGG